MNRKILLIAGDFFGAVVKQNKFIGQLQQALGPAQGIKDAVLLVDFAPLIEDLAKIVSDVRKRPGQQQIHILLTQGRFQQLSDRVVKAVFLPGGPELPQGAGGAVAGLVPRQGQQKLADIKKAGECRLGPDNRLAGRWQARPVSF